MKKMKRNLTFVSLLAVLVMAMGFTSALGFVNTVEFNGVDLSSGSVIAVSPGEVVPVWVQFTADDNASDVTLEVEIKGRNGVSVSKDLSDIEDGSTYVVLLKLKLPETDDELSEEFTLYITVASNTEVETYTYDVSLRVQRESYNLKILSVDSSSKVEAGKAFPVSVVMKNTGYNRADDVYVIASIPALGITTRGYAGDLIPMEDYDGLFEDEEDSVEKIVYLQIPAGAESAVYEMTIEVYNKDSKTEISKLIAVDGVAPNADGDVAVLDGEDKPVSTSVVALTVILAIIFVVLLAVLVVLLTKKEKPIEEVETSYY
jgi:hypothetical protein